VAGQSAATAGLATGFGALAMGTGISAMHYTGMAAMRMQPGIDYDPTLFSASLLIAAGASSAALWIAFRLRQHCAVCAPDPRRCGSHHGDCHCRHALHRHGGCAFADGSFCGAAVNGLNGKGLDNLVLITTLAVLSIALLTSILDARLEAHRRLAHSLTGPTAN
jgi:NO-binding membrane sensor protein with MHYT domain